MSDYDATKSGLGRLRKRKPIVEGRLSEERSRQLQHQTLALVERLEASARELEEINDASLEL